jgi:hypothetical protein
MASRSAEARIIFHMDLLIHRTFYKSISRIRLSLYNENSTILSRETMALQPIASRQSRHTNSDGIQA